MSATATSGATAAANDDAVLALSRELIAKGSKSFAMAARLLPSGVREDAVMLYAWCRHCDDEIDDQHLGFAKGEAGALSPLARLERLREKTALAVEGKADEPVFIALGRVAARHRISARHPFALLDGFRMDVEGRVYETLDELMEYCYHVAGVVGVMMAMIMGVRDEETLRRASDLGLAFQLTNIVRDVADDASVGRVYLPLAWLREVGLRAADVGDPVHNAAVFSVAVRLLDEADAYYRSALYGMANLPMAAGVGIGAARRIYRDIGRIVRARGERAWVQRAAASKPRKLAAATSGAIAALRARLVLRHLESPPRAGLWTMPDLGPSAG